ncbi:hypothetical protein Lser_V15G29848 [Lactuca serriola]
MTTEYPDRIKNFFTELETRRTLLTTITETHNKLINNFISLDEILTKKSQILDARIEKYKKQTDKTLAALTVRDNGIPEKEVALAARVEQLKESAIRDIETGNNSDPEEKPMLDSLRMRFRRMDSKGLIKYLLAKRKESVQVRADINTATEEAVDLPELVLEAVEDFVELKVSGTKVVGMADRRWACGILIQAGLPLLPYGESLAIGRSTKDRAIRVLEIWKGILGGGEGSGGVGSGEATMFLQMVIGFGLKHKFDDEYLRQLVVEFAGRREMAKLAVALGYGDDEMREIIKELVKAERDIEAVYFSFESGLTEEFPPIPLLKSGIKNYQKNTSKEVPSWDDILNEMSVVLKIIKCIEDHKLESQFSRDNLQNRYNELEKMKAASKKAAPPPASTIKPVDKRHRSGGGSSRPPKSARWAKSSHRKGRRPPPGRQPSAARSTGGSNGASAATPVQDGYGGYDNSAGGAPVGPIDQAS